MLGVIRGEGGCEKIRPRGRGGDGEMVVFVVCKEGAQSRKKFRKSSLMIT